MNIQTAGVGAWVVMLVSCKECDAPLCTTSERVKGVCEECEVMAKNPDVFDPYGQPILEKAVTA